MAEQKLLIQQRQSLVMTPQLQQSIKLLQMTSQELSLYVETQLAENPLLTTESEQPQPAEASATQQEKLQERLEESRGREEVDTHHRTADLSDADRGEGRDSTHWDENATSGTAEEAGYWDKVSSGRGGYEEGENPLEQTVADAPSLVEHLQHQLQMDIEDPAERIIGVHIIDCLDEAGYVREPLAQIAEALGCDVAEVEAVLYKLQAFEPVGLFARDLKECLALQLKDRNRFDPAMEALLEHLDLLGKGEVEALMRRCEVSKEDVLEMIAEIRALNPKPASGFAHEVTQEARPDVTVRPDGSGGWRIDLNNDQLPRVLVNQQYHARVSGQARGQEEKKYITEQLSHANWLVKALDQRARTILKVATAVVKEQDLFLKYGIRYLKPLTLKTIADAIEMHESTVSRVTSNKYILTPRGLFELKYFFTSGLNYDTGLGTLSSEAVKAQISLLIERETLDKILSDDDIADVLKERGIDIARRTVAKYREALNIGSSSQRRRQKKLAG